LWLSSSDRCWQPYVNKNAPQGRELVGCGKGNSAGRGVDHDGIWSEKGPEIQSSSGSPKFSGSDIATLNGGFTDHVKGLSLAALVSLGGHVPVHEWGLNSIANLDFAIRVSTRRWGAM
jgi:hypothetical protein